MNDLVLLPLLSFSEKFAHSLSTEGWAAGDVAVAAAIDVHQVANRNESFRHNSDSGGADGGRRSPVRVVPRVVAERVYGPLSMSGFDGRDSRLRNIDDRLFRPPPY